MAWQISITAEGWHDIYHALQEMSGDEIITALVDDHFEKIEAKASYYHADRAATAMRSRINTLPHDILVDMAYELIEANDTCDNGGYGYWIDREGYHKVTLSDKVLCDCY